MRTAKVAMAAAVLSMAAFGQGGPPRGGGFGHEGFGPGMGMHGGGKVVTGAPYTATATNVFSETLVGGNTIQRTTTATVARDSSGRTYTLQTMPAGPMADASSPRTMIFISDPVAGVSYVLDTTKKIAMKRSMPVHEGGPRADGEAGHTRPADASTVIASSTGTYLGTYPVTIKTITHTIPAGKVGNTEALVSTSTMQYSTQLQTEVYATRVDPRFGTSTFSLTDIALTEPSATLFAVPSDYTVKDAPYHGGPGRHGPPPAQ